MIQRIVYEIACDVTGALWVLTQGDNALLQEAYPTKETAIEAATARVRQHQRPSVINVHNADGTMVTQTLDPEPSP